MNELQMKMSNGWRRNEAIEMCARIELLAPSFGCHIALTGGCLYKSICDTGCDEYDGINHPTHSERKDLDIVVYRIRQSERIDIDGLFKAMKERLDVERITTSDSFVIKAKCWGRSIDFLFPEASSGDYEKKKESE